MGVYYQNTLVEKQLNATNVQILTGQGLKLTDIFLSQRLNAQGKHSQNVI